MIRQIDRFQRAYDRSQDDDRQRIDVANERLWHKYDVELLAGFVQHCVEETKVGEQKRKLQRRLDEPIVNASETQRRYGELTHPQQILLSLCSRLYPHCATADEQNPIIGKIVQRAHRQPNNGGRNRRRLEPQNVVVSRRFEHRQCVDDRCEINHIERKKQRKNFLRLCRCRRRHQLKTTQPVSNSTTRYFIF
jgi:hypothetical protein